MLKFPHYKQYDEMDCGAACMRIICKYYGKDFSLDYLRTVTHTNRTGTSMLSLSNEAEKISFRTIAAKLSFTDLVDAAPFPCIAYWNQLHYVVIYKMAINAKMNSNTKINVHTGIDGTTFITTGKKD